MVADVVGLLARKRKILSPLEAQLKGVKKVPAD